MRKRYFLIPLAIIIMAGILALSCKHPFGNGLILPKVNEHEEEEIEESPLYPDSTKITVFTNQHIIPAITVTSNNTIIAAVGDKDTKGKILIKKSKDLGKTWEEVTVSNDADFNNCHVHPFFITAHNNDILLGLSTTNAKNSKITFYRSLYSSDGQNWTKEESATINKPNSVINQNKKPTKYSPTNSLITYGNGVTLRHGANANGKKLMFSYYYLVSGGPNRICIGTRVSDNNGKSWRSPGNDSGHYGNTSMVKALEVEDGSILYCLNGFDSKRQLAWLKSTNIGKSHEISSGNYFSSDKNTSYPRAFDFCRYEFNGRDILDKGLVLVTFSEPGCYKVMMSLDDFNGGKPGTGILGDSAKLLGATSGIHTIIYPAITVLKDGTICTLAAENGDIVFKRFNLAWLSL